MSSPAPRSAHGGARTPPDDGLDGAAVYETVMGPPLAVVQPPARGSMLASWNHPELHEYEMPPTSELVIALQTSGPGVRTRIGRGWSPLAPTGSLHLVPPRTATRWKIDGSLGFVSVHFARERIRDLLERSGAGESRLRDLAFRFALRDPFLRAACRELARELASPEETGALYTDLLADTMLLRILRLGDPDGAAAPTGGLSAKHLRIVKERIEASLSHGVSLDELAEEVGLSRFHLARAFKASTGVPPHRYLTLRRVERAKELLRDPEKPLVEVALETGFSSQSHFTGRFREATGLTPLRYRRRHA